MDEKLPALLETLEEIAILLELSGENPFKVNAYRNAARVLEANAEALRTRIANNTLTEIKGIGEGIAAKIIEFYDSGTIKLHEELSKKIPEGVLTMLKIPGLGPKKILALWKRLNIDSLDKLQEACRSKKIRRLEGFGEKTEIKILKGLEDVKANAERYLLVDALLMAERLVSKVRALPGAAQIEVGGSLRRRVETVHDIDILVVRYATKEGRCLSDSIADLFESEEITAHGDTKVSVKLNRGPNVDFRIVSKRAFPYALCYFTGSKAHNTRLRAIAKDKKLKLNEYGLFKGTRSKMCTDEAALYRALGLDYIPPPLREDLGEIEAAREGTLPRLITRDDIKGILHVHTHYSDGLNSLAEMAKAARDLGMSYMGVAEHSHSAQYAAGLSVDKIYQQHKEIDLLNKHDPSIRVFKGIESDILPDGGLDYEDDVLKTFDFIIGSVHSRFNLSKTEQTKRIIKAIENPHLTMLGHLTGRLLLVRPGYEIDSDKIIDAAIANGVIVEFNCNPQRFDIDWRVLRKAKDKGLLTSINPDAHSVGGLRDVYWGVDVIQKAWIEKESVLNTFTMAEVEKIFRKRKR